MQSENMLRFINKVIKEEKQFIETVIVGYEKNTAVTDDILERFYVHANLLEDTIKFTNEDISKLVKSLEKSEVGIESILKETIEFTGSIEGIERQMNLSEESAEHLYTILKNFFD